MEPPTVNLDAAFVCEKLDRVVYFLLIGSQDTAKRRNGGKREPVWGISMEQEPMEPSFFIWIRCNPLKSPNSAKGIQGNASFFPWFYLDLLALVGA
jgi:hypothetical protein